MFNKKSNLTVVLQQDTQDCGPACLATICKYYGKRIPISYIRKIAGTDRGGTSGYGIVRGAEELGFSCQGALSPEKEFSKDLIFPIIAHLKRNDSEHYVVIFKIKKDNVIIGDPASGLLKIPISEFKKEWSGVFFVLTPQEKFKLNKDSGSILTRFFYLKK